MSEYDCLRCGACCRGDDGWVIVDASDDDRVTQRRELAALVIIMRHGEHRRRSLRMVDGRCAALELGGGGTRCSIYDVRPTICREVEAGSESCLQARRRYGVPT